jgi:adenylate cyclase
MLLSLGLISIYGSSTLEFFFREIREKRWLRQAFGQYVSHTVVEAILAQPERLQLGGEEVEVTVLFADLAGFTTISEDMAPKKMISLLNEYFTAMTQIILNHQGTLDKYIGDALMALWGAPMPIPDHAAMACRTALEMQREMQRLRTGWHDRWLPELTIRIGLHSGPAVAGNVGSRERFNYTVMGDTVNLASRLEGINKYYGTLILLSESTYRQVADTFLVRELDEVQVRGRTQAVTIYELLGPIPEDGLPFWLELFQAGRTAYLERQWSQAASQFERALSLKPADPPAKLYLNRCLSYMQQPPPHDWRGVFIWGNK